jgi:hypothetical protein
LDHCRRAGQQIQNFIIGKRGEEVINYYYVTQYGYAGTTWIGYDGEDIISYKVTYAKQNALLGYIYRGMWTATTLTGLFQSKVIILIHISSLVSTLSNLIFTFNIFSHAASEAWTK